MDNDRPVSSWRPRLERLAAILGIAVLALDLEAVFPLAAPDQELQALIGRVELHIEHIAQGVAVDLDQDISGNDAQIISDAARLYSGNKATLHSNAPASRPEYAGPLLGRRRDA